MLSNRMLDYAQKEAMGRFELTLELAQSPVMPDVLEAVQSASTALCTRIQEDQPCSIDIIKGIMQIVLDILQQLANALAISNASASNVKSKQCNQSAIESEVAHMRAEIEAERRRIEARVQLMVHASEKDAAREPLAEKETALAAKEAQLAELKASSVGAPEGVEELAMQLELAQEYDVMCGKYAGIGGKEALARDMQALLRVPFSDIPVATFTIAVEFCTASMKGLLTRLAVEHVLTWQEVPQFYVKALCCSIQLAPKFPQTFNILSEKLPVIRGKLTCSNGGLIQNVVTLSAELCSGRIKRLLECVSMHVVDRDGSLCPLAVHIIDHIAAVTAGTTTSSENGGSHREVSTMLQMLEGLPSDLDELINLAHELCGRRDSLSLVLREGCAATVQACTLRASLPPESQHLFTCAIASLLQPDSEAAARCCQPGLGTCVKHIWAAVAKDTSSVNDKVLALANELLPKTLVEDLTLGAHKCLVAALADSARCASLFYANLLTATLDNAGSYLIQHGTDALSEAWLSTIQEADMAVAVTRLSEVIGHDHPYRLLQLVIDAAADKVLEVPF